MSLHNCVHSFEYLSSDVLPHYFEALANSLKHPINLLDFHKDPALLPNSAGCYVLSLRKTAQYVGIAKNIRKRVQDHLSKNPSRANLAVRISAKRLNVSLQNIKKHDNFLNEFNISCEALNDDYSVSWVTISNPLEMYIFEPYCAMKLDTKEYNFFDTLQILSPKYT